MSPLEEHIEAAQLAGLRYVSDSQPGIRRQRSGSGFRYLDHEGNPIKDPELLTRIRGLVIPPAWTEVWICPSPDGHIQATARDAAGWSGESRAPPSPCRCRSRP